MSKIDKLSILGIRSFDNSKSEVIQFFSPLTLIVGSNGSGKTTVIECLKYATTGDQPPNTKVGGAFIHDPKLAGEREVFAQVKLSFRGTSGAKMVATRSLQLTLKKDTRTMKTLEAQLLMIKDGERISVSSRVAELDQVVPQYLGASKAVLDNVVFCHQDESLWPMSEPGALKKKFDEIFEAQKYTKAVDHIKALRKNHVEELKLLEQNEKTEKANKDRATKAEKRSKELSAELDVLRDAWSQLGEKIKTVAAKARESSDSAAHFERMKVQLDGKRTEARIKDKSIEDAKYDMEEMSESDDALQTMLDQQDERSRTYQRDIKSKSNDYQDSKYRASEASNELGRKQREHGKFQAEHSQYERQLEQRTALVKDTAARHNVRGFDYDLDNDRVREFIGKMSTMHKDQERTRKRAHDESQKEVGEAQRALNDLNQEKSSLNSSKANAKSQIVGLDRKIQDQQAKLNKMDIDEGSQARLESSMNDTRTQLETLKEKADKTDWQKQVDDAETALQQLDVKREELDAEVLRATKHANETAEVDHLRKSLRSTEDSLSSMKGAHGSELGKLLGAQWETDLEKKYADICRKRSDDLNAAQQQQDKAQRELDHVQFKLKTARSSRDKSMAEAAKCEAQLKDALEGVEASEFPTILQEQEDQREEFSNHSELIKYYQKAQKRFEKQTSCYLCDRKFYDGHDEKKKTDREAIMKKFAHYLDADAEKQEKELEIVKETISTLRKLNPVYETWLRITSKDIPALKQECETLNGETSKVMKTIEQQHDPRIVKCKDSQYDAEKSSKNVQGIVKYDNDVTSLKKQIQALTDKQSQSGVVLKGLDVIGQQQKSLNEELKTARATLKRVRNEGNTSQVRINQLEKDTRDIQIKLNNAATQLREKQNVQAAIDELIGSRNQQREAISQGDRQLQVLGPKITSAQEKYDDLQRRGEERQSQLAAEASKTQNSLNQLQAAQNEITAYLDRQGPQQLAKAERGIEDVKKEQSAIEEETRKLTVEINKLQKEETKHKEVIRGIERNLKYRTDKHSLEQLRAEIQELESRDVENDREKHDRDAKKWTNEWNKLTAEQASTMGQVKTKDDQLAELLNDFNTEFKDANRKYKEAQVKLIATKSVVEDLGRYGGALDKAIMRYHTLKMDEINALIEDLWQKTYKGTDIDNILIRSDNEAGKGNKSYNYRVCMMKQDVEMDMRGRCSAGQKVLASIIIRLALAECFGVSCGLIALDEPTTNLDRENIISLAGSLHDIIEQRKAQRNFQLIIITHDEEFLSSMGCSDFCDHYFRISRNAKQKSEIALQSINEVM